MHQAVLNMRKHWLVCARGTRMLSIYLCGAVVVNITTHFSLRLTMLFSMQAVCAQEEI
jgi:hypothetical protein